MKEGDLVRFVKWEEVGQTPTKQWGSLPKNHVGTLIKHDRLLQACEVLYEGEVIRVRQQLVEKAGKKDLGSY